MLFVLVIPKVFHTVSLFIYTHPVLVFLYYFNRLVFVVTDLTLL